MAGDLTTAHPGEARLRAALAAAASAPVAPAWETIRSQVLDDEPHLRVRLAPQVARPRRAPALLAVAAGFLVLALTGAVVWATRHEPQERFTAVGGAIDPTPGWFVPRDLPPGWTVTSVTALRPDGPRCPGPGEEPARGIRWRRISSTPEATLVATLGRCEPVDTPRGPGDEAIETPARGAPVDVDLGPVTGRFEESLVGSDHLVTWELDGVPWTLEDFGMRPEEVIAVATELATAGSMEATPSGFTVDESWTEPPPPHTRVVVALTSADGVELAYELSPPGAGARWIRSDIGYGLPLEHAPDLAVRSSTYATAPWSLRFSVDAPSVDLDLWGRITPGDAATIRQAGAYEVSDDAHLLVLSLAPASTAEWRELLAGVDHTPVLDQADSFGALADLDVPAPG